MDANGKPKPAAPQSRRSLWNVAHELDQAEALIRQRRAEADRAHAELVKTHRELGAAIGRREKLLDEMIRSMVHHGVPAVEGPNAVYRLSGPPSLRRLEIEDVPVEGWTLDAVPESGPEPDDAAMVDTLGGNLTILPEHAGPMPQTDEDHLIEPRAIRNGDGVVIGIAPAPGRCDCSAKLDHERPIHRKPTPHPEVVTSWAGTASS